MKTIAIGSGKGGVGKTSLTANLTVLLARQGFRVVAMDADFGLANLDVMLNLPPGPTLRSLVEGAVSIEDALRPHESGARVLAGCSGVAELADLDTRRFDVLMRQLQKLEYSTDFLLVDVAAGIHETAISTLAAADESLVVMTADPSSFLDAYATVKRLTAVNPEASIRGVVNQVPDVSAGKLLFARLQTVAREYNQTHLKFGGAVTRDDAMTSAVLARELVVDRAPNSQVVSDLMDLIEMIAPNATYFERPKSSFFTRLFRMGSRSLRAA